MRLVRYQPSGATNTLGIVSCFAESVFALLEAGAGTMRGKDAAPMVVLPLVGAYFMARQAGGM